MKRRNFLKFAAIIAAVSSVVKPASKRELISVSNGESDPNAKCLVLNQDDLTTGKIANFTSKKVSAKNRLLTPDLFAREALELLERELTISKILYG